MRTTALGFLATVFFLTMAGAAQDRTDFTVIEKIRAEGMDRSKVLETFDYLTTVIGPRLTNSPAHRRAVASSFGNGAPSARTTPAFFHAP